MKAMLNGGKLEMPDEKQTNADKNKSAATEAKPKKSRQPRQSRKLKDKIAEMEAKLANAEDAFLRSKAELDNYRKRAARELLDARNAAKADALSSVLSVYDHFKMAMDAAENSDDLAILKQGMEMIAREFDKAMEDAGIQVLDALGTEFDPNLHEAVEKKTSDEREGVIIGQWRCGYKLGDKLLRPASVVVSSGPQSEENGDDNV